MIDYMAQSFRKQSITDPLNNGKVRYYSTMNDGSSSAKTQDEKELYLIKTAPDGSPKFSILSLEEPENANAVGLKAAMDDSFTKAKMEIDRSEHEIGLCSDGASVNISLYNLLKAELGEHYLQMWCPSHRLELAVGDAFEDSQLNSDCEKACRDVYYLFKRATLRWRLFKQQALIENLQKRKYKRPAGTRWVEHQVANLESHNHNLRILIAFLDQQISEPYNSSITKVKPTLEGLRSDICHTDRILFNFVKQDILAIIRPLSKILQENDLIMPSLVSNCKRLISVFGKLEKLFDREGIDAFSNVEIFPATSNILLNLHQTEDVVEIRPTTRSATRKNPNNIHSLYYDFLLSGEIKSAETRVLEEMKSITKKLKEVLTTRLGPLLEDEIFVAIALFLDTTSYSKLNVEMIKEKLLVISKRFEKLLLANGCDITKLLSEFEMLFDHVTLFLSTLSASKAWPNLFSKQVELGIENVIHVAEICIAMPLSNAETERVFSFLWRVFSKERQSLKNKALENALILRSETDTSPNRYGAAIDMFLNVHPNGEVRKNSRRPDGYEPRPKKARKELSGSSATRAIENLVSSDEEEEEENEIPSVDEISDDDWTSSEDED